MDKRDKFPHSAEVEAFKQNILKTAEDLVVNKFPKRIIQLNKMISSGKLTADPSTVYQKINIPVPDVSAKDPSAVPPATSSSSTTTATTTSKANQTSVGPSSSSAQAGTSNGETGVSLGLKITHYILGRTKNQTTNILSLHFQIFYPLIE